MRVCKVCQKEFPEQEAATGPAEQMGAFLAREMYADAGELCPKCLANRGQLAMMYLREFD